MRSSTLALPNQAVARRDHALARLRGGIVFYLGVALLSVFFMGPFIWTVLSSLKDSGEIMTYPPTFLPRTFRFENYVYAWTKVPFVNFYTNSIIVTGLACLGQTAS